MNFQAMRFMSQMLTMDELRASQTQVIRDHIDGLKLNYIHGYRGIDCRDNLFYVDDGKKIVYCAAGAGIVLELATQKQSFYLEHNDDIISLAVNNNPKFKNVVATGQIGLAPTIHVWDALTKETLSILSDQHQEGIFSLDFSSSGRYLVSVGLDSYYTVAVWRWKEGTLVASHVGDDLGHRVFKAAFRPDSDTVFVSVGFKHIRFWSVAGSELISKKGVIPEEASSISKRKLPTLLSIGFGPVFVCFFYNAIFF
jgi:microtubule-associated protein-like 6